MRGTNLAVREEICIFLVTTSKRLTHNEFVTSWQHILEDLMV